MKVAGDWLSDAGTQAIFAVLHRAGHQAFVVGGAVRDAALGVAVRDVDFATDARPDRVLDLAGQADIQAVPTGIDHGTLTLVVSGRGYEVTTFRRDVATDGRRAVVAFSDDIETDARRRDFTMNALYADADGLVHDPLGGWPDLLARHVRFIDDPEQRIREDALRILRFFRFVAHHGAPQAGIDADGLAACAALADLVDGLSAERIGHEMRKLLSAVDPAPAVASMGASGVLGRVAPGAQPALLAPLVDVENGLEPDWMRRITALGADPEQLNWRLSKAETKALTDHQRASGSDEGAAASAYRHGARAARNLALVRASVLGPLDLHDLETQIARGVAAKVPVRAADLMDRYGPGPRLGKALTALTEAWIASDFALDRDALLSLPLEDRSD